MTLNRSGHEPEPADYFAVRTYTYLNAHHERGLRFLLSPDHERLATIADQEYAVRLWRVRDGALLHTFEKPVTMIFSVTFSPDSRLLACASEREATVWRVDDGMQRYSFRATSDYAGCVLFSPDGQYLATTVGLLALQVVRAEDGTLVHRLDLEDADKKERTDVIPLAFSPDGRLLAAGGRVFGAAANAAGRVLLWRIADGARLEAFTGYLPDVADVAFSPDGRTLAARSAGGATRTWRVH